MVVVFAPARFPAPDAASERVAQQMESYLQSRTLGGENVWQHCLFNVRVVLEQCGFTGLGPLGAGTAAACNSQLVARGGVNRSRQGVPRGAVCMWNSSTGRGSGHIAIADGRGNSVNNWGGLPSTARIVRTPLASQGGGWIGWMWPQQVGRPPSHLTRKNPAYTGKATDGVWGIGDSPSDDEVESEPLPKPPKLKAGSGRSRPGLGDDTWTVSGSQVAGALTGLVSSTQLDLAVATVGEVTLTVIDPEQKLASLDLSGTRLGWDGAAWDLSSSSVQAAAATVELHARSVLARRMRRTYRVVGEHKTGPDEWVTKWVKALGGKSVVQKTSKRAVVPESTDQSVADVLDGLCSAMGDWSWTEYAGVVYAGSRMWAATGGPGLKTWPVTWKRDATTDALDVAVSRTDDDPENVGVCDLVLRWEQGRKLRPWHRVQLTGLGSYDGMWLVEAVQTPNDGTSVVQVSCVRPRPQADESTSNPKSKTPPPKGKTTPAYAKWYARQYMAEKYKWGDVQWAALEKLWTRESGWNYRAENPSSGAYGIPQSLPGSKMASAGKDWRTNPETQIKWGLSYIQGRYKTPVGAWAHFQAKNWY